MTGIFYVLLRWHGGGTDTEISVSKKSQPWRRQFSHRSRRDSNPRPFNHESGTLTAELSLPWWCISWSPFLRMLHVLTWLVLISYLVLNLFCSKCLSKKDLKFSVPANTMSDGKLFQLFITLLVKKTCILLVTTVFLYSLKRCPLVPTDSFYLNKEQHSFRIIKTMHKFYKFPSCYLLPFCIRGLVILVPLIFVHAPGCLCQ